MGKLNRALDARKSKGYFEIKEAIDNGSFLNNRNRNRKSIREIVIAVEANLRSIEKEFTDRKIKATKCRPIMLDGIRYQSKSEACRETGRSWTYVNAHFIQL